MTKRKRQFTKVCEVCGRTFETGHAAWHTCSKECAYERHRRLMRESYARRTFDIRRRRAEARRIARGVSEEAAARIAYAQDSGDARLLAEVAKGWTPAERKYALKRYVAVNRLRV